MTRTTVRKTLAVVCIAATLAAFVPATAAADHHEAHPPGHAAAPAGELAADLESDRQAILDHLAHTRQLFLDAVAGLSEEQAAWKPAEDRWSVAEVAEHITLSEDFIRDTIAGMLEAEPAPEKLEGAVQDAKVIEFVVDRSQRFQSPEPVAAKGSWTSLAETVAAYEAARARTVELAKGSDGLRTHAQEHPAFGNLDAWGWLAFLSGHTERHTKQIEEVKATDGFPM